MGGGSMELSGLYGVLAVASASDRVADKMAAAYTEMVRLMNQDMADTLFGQPAMPYLNSPTATSVQTLQDQYNALNSAELDMIDPQRLYRPGLVKQAVKPPEIEPDTQITTRPISFED